jgi:hypothetical protein
MIALDVAPLWPAGHLPHEGGDWQRRHLNLFWDPDWPRPGDRVISSLVGEISGRTEGDAKERGLRG